MILEALLRAPERWANIRVCYGLGDTFDVQGDGNLAPACYPCNSERLDRLLPPEELAIVLARVHDFTGAGDDSAFMDTFEHDVQMGLGNIREFDYSKIVETIETKLRNFHKRHIWPIPKDERPSFDLLIAVQGIKPHGSRALLYTHKTAVLPAHYRSVGVGSYLADYLSRNLDVTGNGIESLVYNSSTEEMERFGIFLIHQIKSAIHGCDGETLVATFRGDGTMKWTLGEEVREIESWFSSFHGNIVPLLRLVSHAETPDREFKQSMGQFNADMNLLSTAGARQQCP